MNFQMGIEIVCLLILVSLLATSSTHSTQVTIDCNKRLGEAAQIGDWMGSGFILYGEPIIHIKDRNHPLVQAWHRVGFRYLPLELLGSTDSNSKEWHFNLSRDSAGKLLIDFTPWDNLLHLACQILDSEPAISFSHVLRELSKCPDAPDYLMCMPRDLNELQEFCKRVVEHTIQWGDKNIKPGATRGLYYSPVDEPDWQGYHNEPNEDQKGAAKVNSVLYYAACYRGIKAADPTAKVGGPRHGQWQHPVPPYPAGFSFRDWLEEFKHYIDAHPDVGADYFSWQDYHYFFEGPNLDDGVEPVRGYLRELGFPNAETVPLLLAGGAGGGTWSDDYTDSKKPKYEMAAYAAHNIIREFKGGAKGRKFGRADYYLFWQNEKWRDVERGQHSALVWMDDSTDPVTLDYTAIYAAFEMMKRMMQEDNPGAQIVQVKANEPLDVMATFSNNPAVIICNYRDQARDVDIKINLPPDYGETQGWTKLRACVQRIDAHHSNDGKGLEPEDNCWWPQPIAIEGDNHEKHLRLSLRDNEAISAWGTILIRLYP